MTEWTARQYDEHYTGNPEYAKHPSVSIYWSVWSQIIPLVPKDAAVLDLGSGTGQFAKSLSERGIKSYIGLDFSREAIRQAKDRNPDLTFVHDTVFNLHHYPYDTIIGLEVLEHVWDDLLILHLIRDGAKCYFSVPNYGGPNHLRYFKEPHEVEARYGPYLKDFQMHSVLLWEPQIITYFLGTR